VFIDVKDSLGTVIDASLDEALLLALPGGSPTATQSVRMLSNILGRVRTESPAKLVTVHSDEGKWEEVVPNVFRKWLLKNQTLDAALYRLSPGSSFPAHIHASDEECFCLEGEFQLGDLVVRSGDYHLAPKGTAHGTLRSPKGCLLYIRSAAMTCAE
jgi:anti-sigma factor ChrR (cupin superfamily)